jgi:hypothetical protein
MNNSKFPSGDVQGAMVLEPYGVYHCLFYAIDKTYMY